VNAPAKKRIDINNVSEPSFFLVEESDVTIPIFARNPIPVNVMPIKKPKEEIREVEVELINTPIERKETPITMRMLPRYSSKKKRILDINSESGHIFT